MPAILFVANLFGISVFRLVAYASIAIAIVVGALTIRQHYINAGWRAHKAAIEKQDNIAIDASKRVEKKADACSDANGFWDVVTQGCKLEEEKVK